MRATQTGAHQQPNPDNTRAARVRARQRPMRGKRIDARDERERG